VDQGAAFSRTLVHELVTFLQPDVTPAGPGPRTGAGAPADVESGGGRDGGRAGGGGGLARVTPVLHTPRDGHVSVQVDPTLSIHSTVGERHRDPRRGAPAPPPLRCSPTVWLPLFGAQAAR
jgi:hypothetical protein